MSGPMNTAMAAGSAEKNSSHCSRLMLSPAYINRITTPTAPEVPAR